MTIYAIGMRQRALPLNLLKAHSTKSEREEVDIFINNSIKGKCVCGRRKALPTRLRS
jgi:hypothetical protein